MRNRRGPDGLRRLFLRRNGGKHHAGTDYAAKRGLGYVIFVQAAQSGPVYRVEIIGLTQEMGVKGVENKWKQVI